MTLNWSDTFELDNHTIEVVYDNSDDSVFVKFQPSWDKSYLRGVILLLTKEQAEELANKILEPWKEPEIEESYYEGATLFRLTDQGVYGHWMGPSFYIEGGSICVEMDGSVYAFDGIAVFNSLITALNQLAERFENGV